MKNSNINLNPSDVAVCFSATGDNVTAASIAPNGMIETRRFSTAIGLFNSLSAWRTDLGHRTDLNTVFRLVPFLFTEQTHIASLSEETLRLGDKALTQWLNKAAEKQMAGEDGIPLFESGLEKTAYDYARLPSGEIALTEVPRERLDDALNVLVQAEPLAAAEMATLTRHLPAESLPGMLHAVETRLRAMTRALVATNEFFNGLKSDETIAVFAFTPEGCGYSLWNPQHSFFAEFGECFNINFEDNEIPEYIDRAEYVGQIYLENVYNFLHEQFYKRVMPENDPAASLKICRIFWTATDGLYEPLIKLLDEFAEQTGFACEAVTNQTLDELVVRGLLLAHDQDAEGRVPSINLANDISVQNDSILAEEEHLKAVADQHKRQSVFACLMLPVIFALGASIGLWLNNERAAASLAWREGRATVEQNRLKPILQARSDYEKTLNWYQDVLRQIIALRQKQTSSLSFAAQLDPLFPSAGAFYISDLKLVPGGAFELKGITRDQAEVANFVKSMEFAADDKENRYFTGLQLEFKQGSKVPITAQSAPAGSTLAVNLAPGISAFVLKGNYAPAAVLKAQPPLSPTSQPAASVPAPNNNTAANSNSLPVSNVANTNTNSGGKN